jgi:hypothetical protein
MKNKYFYETHKNFIANERKHSKKAAVNLQRELLVTQQ